MTRLHVLGVGALGTLVTHHIRIANPSLPITLLLRDPSKFPKTIRVTRDDVESTSSNYELAPSVANPSHSLSSRSRSSSSEIEGESEPIESLLVTLKAPQTVSAIKPLVHRLKPNSVISLLQNGMGTYQALCSELFPDPSTRPYFILGTTPHGVAPNSHQNGSGTGGKGDVRHHTAKGQGDIKWGVCPDPRASVDLEQWIWSTQTGTRTNTDSNNNRPLAHVDLAKLEVPSGRPELTLLRDTIQVLVSATELHPALLPINDVDKAMLLKVAINATINSLTAILGRGELPNGSLSSINPSGTSLVDAVVKETSVILLAHLDRSASASGDTSNQDHRRVFEYEPLRKLIENVIDQTQGNTSSMAVDVREKRTTEIEFINGYLVKLGDELGIPTTVNRLICDMVRFITASQGGR
ncbi:hypothetical protein IAU59_000294 [Kwoniella sp. CBS 9459]